MVEMVLLVIFVHISLYIYIFSGIRLISVMEAMQILHHINEISIDTIQ